MRIILAITILLFNQFVFASGPLPSKGTISSLGIASTGISLQLKDGSGALLTGDPDNCGRDYRFHLLLTHANYDSMYSSILAALMSGKEITLYLNGCSPTWPIIWTVDFGEHTDP